MKRKTSVREGPGLQQLESVSRRLEHFRRSRKQRRAIPEALWEAAAGVAQQVGVSHTARVLRLDYYTLKDRLASLVKHDAGDGAPQPRFVELIPPVVPPSGVEWTVELERPTGCRMRIHVQGAPPPDLTALSRAFLPTGRP